MGTGESKKIYLAALGCAKNQVDGELMLGAAASCGHRVVGDPAAADVVVVNTCAFIGEARRESVERILELAELKRDGKRLVVTGCMAERYGRELAKEIPEIDSLLGTGAFMDLPRALDAASPKMFPGPKHYLQRPADRRRVDVSEGWAYIKVSEGCDHECSFCAIPSIRGRHRSRPQEDVVEEASVLAAQGVVEINLVAQDLSAYGCDRGEPDGLARLLERLDGVAGIERVRCLYLYPNTLSDGLLDTMASLDSVCSYVDLPLQHADETVLRLMGRGGGRGQFERLVHRVRERLPGAALRTTFIAGFPGETEQAFAVLCDLVEALRFDSVGVFAYSPEEGTPAAALPGRVPPEEAARRRDFVMAVQEAVSAALLAERVGGRERVLLGGCSEDGNWWGRCSWQAPEVDSVTWLGSGLEASAGTMVDAEITASAVHEVFARVIPRWP